MRKMKLFKNKEKPGSDTETRKQNSKKKQNIHSFANGFLFLNASSHFPASYPNDLSHAVYRYGSTFQGGGGEWRGGCAEDP